MPCLTWAHWEQQRQDAGHCLLRAGGHGAQSAGKGVPVISFSPGGEGGWGAKMNTSANGSPLLAALWAFSTPPGQPRRSSF